MVVAGGEEGSGGRTVVVGVKLDSQSRELLTWALVKVARAGDLVVALHVLDSNEIVDRDGQSSLLSMVKSFDSILAVYEGFCNLKQVDLKLKICRGSSIRKILVSESKSYSATQLIVGTSHTHHAIRSSSSMAKYCAKKLSKDCSVLAVNNGKIAFRRESNSTSLFTANETVHQQRNGLMNTLQRSFSRNCKVTNDVHLVKTMLSSGQDSSCKPDVRKNCLICSLQPVEPDGSPAPLPKEEPSADDSKENSMAIMPLRKKVPIRGSTELKPGWPLLRSAISSNGKSPYSSHVRQISVVEWAMRLPSRYCSSFDDSTRSFSAYDFELDRESRAIVSAIPVPLSPDCNSGNLPQELKDFLDKHSATCRLFSFHELVFLTSNFSPGSMIGKGGSSKVYRGCLPDGKELAVKILKPSEDAIKEFTLEIEIINTMHHKNIISLFGFCFEDNHLLLVYDFLSRGSLEENLHGARRERTEFGWNERYKVAIGVAEALDHLHNQEPQAVIHKDVKSSNILLSDDFEPQLSDFGLATWASTTSSHVTCSDVAGTFGYLAPEYFMYGKVNEKIDVYAYGVVLLELLSGRKPISSNCPKGEESLVIWAKPILNSGKLACMLDPKIGNCYDREQAERMLLAASLCIRRAPRARPHMSFVVKLLEGEAETTRWARLQVNASEGCDMKLGGNAVEGWDMLEDETFSKSNLRSHLNLALLGMEEDSVSVSSIEQSVSLEEYLRSRWSHSSSFD